MGVCSRRDTITSLDLLTEQIHTIWNCGNQWVASMLCLDVAGVFDHVSHPCLLHILRWHRVPNWIVNWVESFLKDRQSTIQIVFEESDLCPVQSGIPQGSPISPILYLFFNEELVQICNSFGLHSSTIGFVDDINILTWSNTTEQNCTALARIHSKCCE
jgi:hypothetical protein